MNILVASDSFKGSLSSMEVAQAVTTGIHRVFPQARVLAVPMADGGEGTVQALVAATGGKLVDVKVTGPLGTPVTARFGWLPDGTAVLEMAAASGLTLVPEEKRDPTITTTFGTGELIKAALDRGVSKIVMGIGGSATNDGGAGMFQALGGRLLDETGRDLGFGGGQLDKLHKIDTTGLDPRLKKVQILVACDVQNPLCGPGGASAVYGPQKGATPEMVQLLDANLNHFAEKIKEQLGIEVKDIPGAGAAGGLGAGLMAFTGAALRSGVEIVLDTINIDRFLEQVDLVITGEGQIDSQSAYGKVPVGVAARAARYNVPVIAVAGSIGQGAERLFDYGIQSIITIVKGPVSLQEAMANGGALTADAVERAFRLFKVANKMKGIFCCDDEE
ncbi:glycerate kinase [Desulforamulus putei]|uniref:Glycerate kinase n=1 Tax=Desulforamulus putei DSM 12395 TaxID=1121429 RepID=A0A1M4VXC5_9FIRM|nr:glycerate kinase [Desulforamulus putei]SHE73626.1 glycerate kinase [Desulforamulus putei DSM 12395]